jgi:hypothetical protein
VDEWKDRRTNSNPVRQTDADSSRWSSDKHNTSTDGVPGSILAAAKYLKNKINKINVLPHNVSSYLTMKVELTSPNVAHIKNTSRSGNI